MLNKNVIVKFDEAFISSNYKLRSIKGTLTAESIVGLIDSADLQANPREAKVGSVTDAILDTLEKSPELFPFMSKGVLIASAHCKELERKRFALSFHDDDIEGVLDGGHNMLAIAIYIIRKALGDDASVALRGAKNWSAVAAVWQEHRAQIDLIKKDLHFMVPAEVIYPHDTDIGPDDYKNSVLEIAQARNNNVELTEATKAHKAGYFDVIKESVDPEIAKIVEWKTNDGGRIKVQDLVALSWVAINALPVSKVVPGFSEISPVTTYSSKAMCVKAFSKLMLHEGVSVEAKGAIRELTHPAVKSALGMMKDLPRLYDLIYRLFPDAYLESSSGFGRISSVRIYETGKHNPSDSKYLKFKPKSKYYGQECKYEYPDGFIAPIVWALSELMYFDGNELKWATDPDVFIQKNMSELLKSYHGLVSLASYDPQKVGKNSSFYEIACNVFRGKLK